MRAVVIDHFGSPEVMECRHIPIPSPGPGEVLIRNTAVGVGKPDILVRSGQYPYLEKYPPMLTIGNECAGYVEQVGPGVHTCRQGDAVWVLHSPGYGAYAEYICAKEQYVTVLPPFFAPESAPGLLNFIAAYSMLHDAARGTDGKSLYISGAAGGLGTALIKLALAEGMDVIASASTQHKCDHLRKLGTSCVFNYREEDAAEKIAAFTGGRGVDLVFDQRVGDGLFSNLDLLADFGMVLVYNWLDGAPSADFYTHMLKHAANASAIRFYSSHVYDRNPERKARNTEKMFELFEQGKLTMEHYVSCTLPLEAAREAHIQLEQGTVVGKMILKI